MKILAIGNEERYNHITLNKSQEFIDNLQDFLFDSEFVKGDYEECTFNGKDYDSQTYYSLVLQVKDDGEEEERLLTIKEFDDGEIIRYKTDDSELLIIFFVDTIELIFYCSSEKRQKVIAALEKFVQFSS